MEELKERYKMLPMWARLLIASLIGVLPAAYIYFDEGDSLQNQLVEAQGQEESARTKFETSRKKKANVPQLEEQLAFTEEQLQKAKQKLPDTFRIEDVLQKTATIAKQTGARLMVFDPSVEAKHTQPYQYVELPIKTEVEGKFTQIAAFFDRIVHLDGSIFLHKIELTRMNSSPEGREAERLEKLGDFQKAKAARDNMKIKGSFDIVVFRGMSEQEAAATPSDDVPQQGRGKAGKTLAPAPGAPGKNPAEKG